MGSSKQTAIHHQEAESKTYNSTRAQFDTMLAKDRLPMPQEAVDDTDPRAPWNQDDEDTCISCGEELTMFRGRMSCQNCLNSALEDMTDEDFS